MKLKSIFNATLVAPVFLLIGVVSDATLAEALTASAELNNQNNVVSTTSTSSVDFSADVLVNTAADGNNTDTPADDTVADDISSATTERMIDSAPTPTVIHQKPWWSIFTSLETR